MQWQKQALVLILNLLKQLHSNVWEFYQLQVVNGQRKALCLLCTPHKEMAFCGETRNLREHLTSQHPLSTKQEKEASLLEYSKRSRCSADRSKHITKLIVDMNAIDLRPLRLVECKGFLNLMGNLEQAYKVLSAMHIHNLLKRRHTTGVENSRISLLMSLLE